MTRVKMPIYSRGMKTLTKYLQTSATSTKEIESLLIQRSVRRTILLQKYLKGRDTMRLRTGGRSEQFCLR
jgi:hypothetical protein